MKYIIILLLIILLLLSLTNSIYNTRENYDNNIGKVDMVYTWVDATDEFMKEKSEWANKENQNYDKPSDIRYTQYEELKYALRSLEKYFPHFNNVYIVVKDGQYPKYLKKQHPRLKVVYHSEIMPKEFLPTFNSRAIEGYIHKIPNLSEYYLYSNDDFMFLKDADLNYFADEKGVPFTIHTHSKINHTPTDKLNAKSSSFRCGLNFNSNILDDITKKEDRYELSHTPMLYRVSYDNEIEKFFKNYHFNSSQVNMFDKNGSAKFRRCDDLYLVSLLKPYLYKNWFGSKQKQSECVNVRDFNNIRDFKEKFLNMEVVDNYNSYVKFMNHLYPQKSSFEI